LQSGGDSGFRLELKEDDVLGVSLLSATFENPRAGGGGGRVGGADGRAKGFVLRSFDELNVKFFVNAHI
jgi:hypothetical protein